MTDTPAEPTPAEEPTPEEEPVEEPEFGDGGEDIGDE